MFRGRGWIKVLTEAWNLMRKPEDVLGRIFVCWARPVGPSREACPRQGHFQSGHKAVPTELHLRCWRACGYMPECAHQHKTM